MAIVGHWANLAEAQKLTQSMLLQGVIETVIEAGNLLPLLPMKQITGKDLVYNREKSWTASSGAGFFDIREQIPWTSDVDYDQITVALKRVARQDPWDKFVAETYNSINDYRAIVLSQVTKRITRFLEHKLIYGDVTYNGAKEFDGLHALAEELSGDNDIDQAEAALSLDNVRKAMDACKVDQAGRGSVYLLMPRPIARRLDEAFQEAGFVRTSVTHSMGQIQWEETALGRRIKTFDDVPIIRSDFLLAEEANTGQGSNARGTSPAAGSERYSAFVCRFAQTEDGGLSALFGGSGHNVGEVFKHTPFPTLEDFDSGGERLVGYIALALGASYSLARITDITDVAIVP